MRPRTSSARAAFWNSDLCCSVTIASVLPHGIVAKFTQMIMCLNIKPLFPAVLFEFLAKLLLFTITPATTMGSIASSIRIHRFTQFLYACGCPSTSLVPHALLGPYVRTRAISNTYHHAPAPNECIGVGYVSFANAARANPVCSVRRVGSTGHGSVVVHFVLVRSLLSTL